MTTTQTQEWLTVSTLHVPAEYQRPLDHQRVKREAAEFDPEGVGTLTVSRRTTGEQVLLDGQHRQAILFAIDWHDQKVPCLVYEGLSLQDEARIFRVHNANRVRLSAIDLYRAALVEGKPEALAIEAVLVAHDVRVGSGNNFRNIQSPGALEKLLHHGGKDLLDQVIGVVIKAWGRGHEAFYADNLLGVGVFLARYGQWIEEARLVSVLERVTPAQLRARGRTIRELKGGRAGIPVSVASVIHTTYNQGLRVTGRRLPQWQEPSDRTLWRPVKPVTVEED